MILLAQPLPHLLLFLMCRWHTADHAISLAGGKPQMTLLAQPLPHLLLF
jgi:hypothetical protein